MIFVSVFTLVMALANRYVYQCFFGGYLQNDGVNLICEDIEIERGSLSACSGIDQAPALVFECNQTTKRLILNLNWRLTLVVTAQSPALFPDGHLSTAQMTQQPVQPAFPAHPVLYLHHIRCPTA